MRPRRHAFTLVELLVVIGIIGVLISILLPSLTRARESGATLACMSNQRQIAMAILMYAGENKGWMPQMDKLDRTLESYKISRDKGSKVWTCPSRNDQLTYVTEVNPISYCFSQNTMVYVNGPGNGKKLSQIRNPARVLLMGDGKENQPWGAWIFIDDSGPLSRYNWTSNGFNDRNWFNTNGHKLNDKVYVPLADRDGGFNEAPSGLRYRHNRNSAVATAYMDGHAEPMKKDQLTKANFITAW